MKDPTTTESPADGGSGTSTIGNVGDMSEALQMAMFTKIALKADNVKSQQKDEKELTLTEKENYLKELFNENPQRILYQFGKYLENGDLELFKNFEDYEIQFYVEKYKSLLNPTHKRVVVKNRRYNYLKNVLRNTDYFDDNELKKSNPYLYKQYVGQYNAEQNNDPEEKFSDFLLRGIDDKITNFRCELEEKAFEEEEYDTDSDEEEELETKDGIPDQEKQFLRQEFLDIVENNFLEGDGNFDYSNIDDNEEYDKIEDHDMEEHYFDEEVPNETEELHIYSEEETYEIEELPNEIDNENLSKTDIEINDNEGGSMKVETSNNGD